MKSNEYDDPFAVRGEMAALMRGTHWSQTPLGAADDWPQSLRTVVRVLLTSRFARWMGWGPELTFFYNDAYRVMALGAKHPWALGRPSLEMWAEIWPLTVSDTGEGIAPEFLPHSSSASVRQRAASPGTTAASVSVWPSAGTSWRRTAGASTRQVQGRGADERIHAPERVHPSIELPDSAALQFPDLAGIRVLLVI